MLHEVSFLSYNQRDQIQGWVYAVSNWLISTGHKVTTRLYSGCRHEIHNYADIKFEVELGIVDFMDAVLGYE